MGKRLIRTGVVFSALIVLTLFVFVHDVLTQSQKNFLWRVQSKTNTVYLLGSFHLFKKTIYPLNPRIENAFNQSGILAVEANINDIKNFDVDKLSNNAFYQEGDSLKKHVSPETYQLITKETDRLGLPPEVIDKEKPWFLSVTLEAFEMVKQGFDSDSGIDQYFLSKAEEKKRIVELESLDYQLNLLSSLPDEEQELFLLSALKDLNTLEQDLDQLTKTWTSGDTKGMESLLMKGVLEDKRLSSIYAKILYERNKNMVLKIEDFLKASQTYFVIVGAGHLVGERGIVESLRGKGYSIEQL